MKPPVSVSEVDRRKDARWIPRWRGTPAIDLSKRGPLVHLLQRILRLLGGFCVSFKEFCIPLDMSLRGLLWENFLESIAQVLSRILTDEETEGVLASVSQFGDRLQKINERLRKELGDDELQKALKLCSHKYSCTSHGTRGWIKAFLAGLILKYAMDGIPMILSGKFFSNNG